MANKKTSKGKKHSGGGNRHNIHMTDDVRLKVLALAEEDTRNFSNQLAALVNAEWKRRHGEPVSRAKVLDAELPETQAA